MYPRTIKQYLISSTKPNLKTYVNQNNIQIGYFYNLKFMLRQLPVIKTLKNNKYVQNTMQLIMKNERLQKLLNYNFLPRSLKDDSRKLMKIWAYQCECILIQRLQRGQQMFTLYSKLWQEQALKDFLKTFKQQLAKKSKDFAFGAIGIGISYNWDTKRIKDKEIKEHLNELDYVHLLKEKTRCDSCIRKNNSNVCQCESIEKRFQDNWSLFIEKPDLIVWRRTHPSGCFEYKVYGSYKDVTAEDFLNVQIDTNYRRKWDSTAVVLEIVETESSTNSDVVYWEMQWPKLFANRDYVFTRRYMVDYNSKTVLVMSKITDHPSYPLRKGKFRVLDYWSCMVIKPYTELNKPGIEFSLTYFDNPGVNIPQTVTTWVAMRAMPDYLDDLRTAAIKYKSYCRQAGVKCIYNMVVNSEDEPIICLDYNVSYYDEDIITDNTIFEAQHNIKRSKDNEPTPPHVQNVNNVLMDNNTTITSPTNVQNNNNNNKNSNFWKYLQPNYYFN